MADDDTMDEMTMEEAMAAEAAETAEAGTPPELAESEDESVDGDEALLSGNKDDEDNQRSASELAAVYNIPVRVSAVLGRSSMQVSSLLKMGRGAVIELDRKVGEAIDIYVNNRLVARGEVVVVDERLGVTMTEIIKGGKN
jgi:flagellar motor switch protein FliN